ncbi:uncharacterized [Tachysurus ichikawai]
MCSSFKLDSCEIFEHCGIKFSISESRKLKLEDRVCPAFRTSIKATLLGCLCRRFRNRKQICVPASVLLCECATASKQPGNAIPAQASSRIWAHVSLAEHAQRRKRTRWPHLHAAGPLLWLQLRDSEQAISSRTNWPRVNLVRQPRLAFTESERGRHESGTHPP